MTYIRTSKRPANKILRAIASVVAGVVVVIILIQVFVPYFLPALFMTIARPFWRMEFSVENGSLDSPGSLLAQNADLENQITALQVSQQSVQMLQSDNSALLLLLGRPIASSTALAQGNPSTPGRTLAAVLARPPFSPYDELVIDVGIDQSIAPGAKVYAPGNVLIGTTTLVLGESSRVLLFSSPGEQYPVMIGPSNIPATAIGRGGGQYEAEVPQASKINQGDAVTDSSLSDSLFGTVTAVVANPTDPFETVLFSPPVNIYELRWVLVETPPAAVMKTPAKK